jgi:hypothetical protein
VGGFQFGPRDPLSVMNYRTEPPMITQNDVDCTTALYWLPGVNADCRHRSTLRKPGHYKEQLV